MSNVNSNVISTERVCQVRSWATALWLMACGHKPSAAIRATDGSGGYGFQFPPAANAELTRFHQAKDALSILMAEAQQMYAVRAESIKEAHDAAQSPVEKEITSPVQAAIDRAVAAALKARAL